MSLQNSLPYLAVGAKDDDTDLSKVVGSLHEQDGKIYRLVKAGGTLAAEDIVAFDVSSGAPGWTVTDSTTANDHKVAGVIPTGTPALASGDYFYIQVSGEASVTSAAAISAGVLVGCSATAGKADDLSITAGVGAIGVSLESAAGADESVGVLLKGLI